MDELKQRIQKAKERPYLTLNSFNIGDVVYPFFARNLVNWGVVVDINPTIRKVVVNFNGINRQFDPEWLIKTNPQLKQANNKKKFAQKFNRMVESVYYKEAPSVFKMSRDEKEMGEAVCPKCKSVFEIHYDVNNKQAVLVCPKCGRKLNQSKIACINKIDKLAKKIVCELK